MTPLESPSDWKLPEWHPDLKVPAEKELEVLREFTELLQGRFPGVKASLEIPEPGLIYVHLEFADGRNAEVFATAISSARDAHELAIYLLPDTELEEEFHVFTIEDAVALIANRGF
jgi:hypothetical protein